MCLTGTAEVPLGGLLMDKIIMEEELPIRMVAYGHCFRAESGSAGMSLSHVLKLHDEDSLQNADVSLLSFCSLICTSFWTLGV